MAEADNKILQRMLDRLFAGLVTGPNLNCRPHSSRQRLDFAQVQRLGDLTPEEALGRLLGPDRAARLTARTPAPKRLRNADSRKSSHRGRPPAGPEVTPEPELSPEERAQIQAWTDQQAVVRRLRIVADEARTYEQDTGVQVLNVGFPLLSLPPGTTGSTGGRAAAKRVLAPVAFIPVTVTVRAGPTPVVEVACRADGIDRVTPNQALLAWLEQQTGVAAGELFADEAGADPWREIAELVRHVATALKLEIPEPFAALLAAAPAKQEQPNPPTAASSAPDGATSAPPENPTAPGTVAAPSPAVPGPWHLHAAPRADEDDARPRILAAAVLGLFPMHNQGLLRDTQAMAQGDALDGPVESFIRTGVSLDRPPEITYDHEAAAGPRRARECAQERLVAPSDPCQSRAVRLARQCRGLVVHGPPGTGKSQTITNVIADHLARGERVLMVCDKRTALDVVANRLEHLGLGALCALVHDPRRDQRDLYRAIREQLEGLGDVRTEGRAETKLAKADAELQRLHDELTVAWSALMEKEAGGGSFHELVGQWLAAAPPAGARTDDAALAALKLPDLEQHEHDVGNVLSRAEHVQYARCPWTAAAGVALSAFLARPMDAWRQALDAAVDAARAADATASPVIPAFAAQPSLAAQGQARLELAGRVERILGLTEPAALARWAGQDVGVVRRARQKLTDAAGMIEVLHAGPLDAELALVARTERTGIAELGRQLATIDAYLAVAPRWYGVFFLARRARANRVLARYGLPPGRESAGRLRTFLVGLRARLVLQGLYAELSRPATPAAAAGGSLEVADDVMDRVLARHTDLFDLLLTLHTEPALAGLAEGAGRALTEPAFAAGFLEGLRQSPARAAALERLQSTLAGCGLFDAAWLAAAMQPWRNGQTAGAGIGRLRDTLDSLEDVLRVRTDVAALPAGLRGAVEAVLGQPLSAEEGWTVLHRAALANAVSERLRTNPTLQALDRQRLQSSFDRFRELEQTKAGQVRDLVLHRWVTKQRERLLVSTGSRLSSAGADLRRRLTMRGERALRLRQVVAVGQGIEGGDPLFDLRPVWMASPETVAQVFPRRPLFDVVVFDEASQCRLEEALPVLTRAHRVVIAGDPKQLPPTRFFESAVAASEDDEVETEQDLFEVHQAEVEDLLTAALGLAIEQCYLDVHYRSRNADLIAFSNRQFYSERLQPIPGHPSQRARFAPVTLYRADGLYEERTNAAEAEQVCRIVRDLLRRAEPPSIGVASFNLAQRDLIVEKLDELAAEDREFAGRLAEARVRRGPASFEGLFVKNLENVQGDERDHIIISTTYGPDAQGRFYRRFGPLGRAGGGRRLNVLVTRARQEVHLVTSIPPAVYRSLPPVPAGQAPGGAWLLFAYLAFAEGLTAAYEEAHQAQEAGEPAGPAAVHVHPTRATSPFAAALARVLAEEQHTGSEVYWGNDGFCVDLALHHPRRADDVTVGVLCDAVRFSPVDDPVAWELFRTAVLEGQGWKLHRLWTPHFFRDPRGSTEAIRKAAAEFLAGEKPGGTP